MTTGRPSDSIERKQIEADFLAAIKRIKKNVPKHPDLATRAAKGKLKLSAFTLAMEAGRSRTLIGHDNCAYPHIRAELLKASASETESRTSLIDDLKQQLEEAKKEAEAAVFWQGEHFLARQKAERSLAREKELLAECRQELAAAKNGEPKLSKVKG